MRKLSRQRLEPFDHKILRNDIAIYMNGDEDLCKEKK